MTTKFNQAGHHDPADKLPLAGFWQKAAISCCIAICLTFHSVLRKLLVLVIFKPCSASGCSRHTSGV